MMISEFKLEAHLPGMQSQSLSHGGTGAALSYCSSEIVTSWHDGRWYLYVLEDWGLA